MKKKNKFNFKKYWDIYIIYPILSLFLIILALKYTVNTTLVIISLIILIIITHINGYLIISKKQKTPARWIALIGVLILLIIGSIVLITSHSKINSVDYFKNITSEEFNDYSIGLQKFIVNNNYFSTCSQVEDFCLTYPEEEGCIKYC